MRNEKKKKEKKEKKMGNKPKKSCCGSQEMREKMKYWRSKEFEIVFVEPRSA